MKTFIATADLEYAVPRAACDLWMDGVKTAYVYANALDLQACVERLGARVQYMNDGTGHQGVLVLSAFGTVVIYPSRETPKGEAVVYSFSDKRDPNRNAYAPEAVAKILLPIE